MAIKCGLIIDGTSSEPLRNGVILIEDETILQIGEEKEVNVTSAEKIVDLKNQVVLPGLIDSHFHIYDSSWGPVEDHPRTKIISEAYCALFAAEELKRELTSGVTTGRLLGQHGGWTFALRKAAEDGIIASPRLLMAGKGLKSPYGHGFKGEPTFGPDEFRKRIRENFAQGADCTKIFITGAESDEWTENLTTYISQEEIEAAVEETHRVGKKIAAHAAGGVGTTWFIEAGGDSIEHGEGLSDEQLDLMLKKGTYLDMSLYYYFHDKEGAFGRPNMMAHPFMKKKIIESKAMATETYRKAIEKGLNYTIHQDGPKGLIPWSIEYLVTGFGVSPMEAIKAATRNAAENCGILETRGTLEAGKYADMISLKRNPLENIEAINEIETVIVGGKIFDTTTGFWKGQRPSPLSKNIIP